LSTQLEIGFKTRFKAEIMDFTLAILQKYINRPIL
jgi:hypothetical protein